MSYLTANLSALEAVLGSSPRLPEDDGRVRLDATGPVPVLCLAGSAGGLLALNSRRDPLAEAFRVLDAALAGRPDPKVVVAVGLGLGFIIDAIEQRCPSARVVAIEPELACVRPLLERRDFSPLLSSGRLLLLWGPQYRGAETGWRFVDVADDSRVAVTHPVLARMEPQAFAGAASVLDRMVFGARANAEAKRKFAGRYLLNTLANLPMIARSGDVSAFFGAFRGTPAVIASAGPSLDSSIAALTNLDERALLIAVDTAARPLLSAGVSPHLVVGADPGEVNGRHLRSLPDTRRTWLVAEGSLAPPAFAEFTGRTFTFQVSNHHPWPWLGDQGLKRGTLKAWGSVATSALDLAVKAGCDPIVFVGQDLGFTDGRPYCRGTTYENGWAEATATGMSVADVWARDLAARSLLTEPDLRGVRTAFTRELRAFRDWLLEEFSRHPERRFINAAGAGFLVGPGVAIGSLEDALSSPPSDPSTSIRSRIATLHERSVRRGDSDPATLAEHLRLADRGMPGREWRAFAAPMVGDKDISAVVVASSEQLVADERQAPESPANRRRPGVPAPLFLAPERAAVIRALRLGEPVPEWAVHNLSGAPGIRPVTAARVFRRLLSILNQDQLLDASDGADRPTTDRRQAWRLVPSLALPWSETIVTRVRELEDEVLALALAVRPCTSGHAQGPAVATRAPVGPGTPEDLDIRARCELLSLIVDLARYRGGTRDLDVMADLLSSAASVGNASPNGLSSPARVSVIRERATAKTRQVHELTWWQEADSVAAALHGSLVDCKPPSGSQRGTAGRTVRVRAEFPRLPVPDSTRHVLSVVASRCRRIPSRFLTDEGLGPARFVSSLNNREALVTLSHGRTSFRVNEDGRWVEHTTWPEAVVAAVPWGNDGALAWDNGTVNWPSLGPSFLFVKETGASRPVKLDLSFRPGLGIRLRSGMAWVLVDGGLAVWAENGRNKLLFPHLHLAGVTLEGRDLRLDPGSPDQAAEGRPASAWLVAEDESLREIPLGPLGARTSVASSGGVTAIAYPYAGLVELRLPGERVRLLACQQAVSLAWAGPSLVVGTRESRVLFFPDVVRQIEDLP